MRRALATAVAAALLALAGCGGDDEGEPSATGGGQETAAQTATEPSRDTTPTTRTGPEKTETESGSGGAESPEDQQGGAGDEIPARTQALLTGRGGRIGPRRVRVPPFIAVQIELRSADGRRYTVAVAGRKLSVGGGLASASTRLAGLRPGKLYLVKGSGGSRTRIEATAEPGP